LIKKYGTREQLTEYCTRIHPTTAKYLGDKVEKPVVRLPADFQLLATSTSVHPNVKAIRKYLWARGLTDDDFWYFKFGYSQEYRWSRRVIMPSFDSEGSLNYFTARAVDQDRSMRYDNADAEKSQIIFNEMNIDWTQRLVVCEGPFDMVKCGENAVPLLGNTMLESSILFCNIIAHSTPIVIALDSKETSKMQRIAQKLAEYDVDAMIVNVSPFKDPGEMSKEQFQEALHKARSVSWGEMFTSRLSFASRTSMKV
jgi:hypothetical protein